VPQPARLCIVDDLDDASSIQMRSDLPRKKALSHAPRGECCAPVADTQPKPLSLFDGPVAIEVAHARSKVHADIDTRVRLTVGRRVYATRHLLPREGEAA